MATVLKISLIVLLCGVCLADEVKQKVVSEHVNTIEEHESIEQLPKEATTLKSMSNDTMSVKLKIKTSIGDANGTTTEELKITPLVLKLNETTPALPIKSNCTSSDATTIVKTPKRATRNKKASKNTKPSKKQNSMTTPQTEDDEFNPIDKNPFFKLKF